MKVLLLSPPSVRGFARDARSDFVSLSDSHWLPIWLAYCGALLEKYSHEVKLIDAPVLHLSPQDTLKKIIDFHPELAVVYSSTKTQEYDIEFCRIIKDKIKCKIIFVGPFVSPIAVSVLKNSSVIDAVVKREFEFPVLEIANMASWKKIRNLAWRENGSVIENEERPPLSREELDSLPYKKQRYELRLGQFELDFAENFLRDNDIEKGSPLIGIVTGAGCLLTKISKQIE